MPTLLLILATVFWGVSLILIKVALQEISPLSFIFFRFLIAALCMLPGLVYLNGKLKRKDLIRGAQLGVLLGGIVCLQTIGLQTITASVSSFLTGFAVVFVLAIRFFVQKKAPRFLDIVTALACVAGLGLVTRSHGLTWEPGVFYTLGCTFFLALYIYTLSAYAGSSQIWVLTLSQMVTLTLLAGLAAVLLESKVQVPTQAATWTAILLCAVFCSAVCFGIQAYTQQYLSAFKASMITVLEPVFATIFSYLLLDEVLPFSFYIGASMILGAIGLINWRLKGFEE